MFRWVHKKPHYVRLELPNPVRGLGQFADLRGGLLKKRMVFLRGVGTPMHTMDKVGGWRILR